MMPIPRSSLVLPNFNIELLYGLGYMDHFIILYYGDRKNGPYYMISYHKINIDIRNAMKISENNPNWTVSIFAQSTKRETLDSST